MKTGLEVEDVRTVLAEALALATPPNPSPTGLESGFALIALAEAVLPHSRSLADWERKDADEFFWFQFQ